MTTTTTLAELENICHRLCTLSRKTTSMNAFALPARHRHKAETKATLPFVGGEPQFHQEFYTAARCRELCLEVVALQQSIRSMMPPPQQQQQLRPPANLAALHSSPTPSSPVVPDVESPLFPAGTVPVSSTLGWTSPRPSAPSSSLPSIPRTCQQCGTAKTPEWRRGPHGSQTLCNACGLQWIKASRSGNGLAPISTPQHKPVHKRSPIKAGAGQRASRKGQAVV